MLKLLEKIEKIPELPEVAYKILEEATKEEVNYELFSKYVEGSPSLMLKIFQFINSPFYALPNKVTKLSQAIGLIGIKQVVNLALIIFVIDILKDFKSEKEQVIYKWKHILTAANASKIISENEELFLASLISEIPDYLSVILKSEGYKIESTLDNIDFYKQAISIIVRKWNIPENLRKIILNYFDFKFLKKNNHSKESIYIFVANILADSLLLNGAKEGTIHKIKKLLKFDDKKLFHCINKIEENTNSIFSLFENGDNIEYSNILSIFDKANSKIYNLLIENDRLLKQYISVNNILKLAFDNLPIGVLFFENKELAVFNEVILKIFKQPPLKVEDFLEKELIDALEKHGENSIKLVTTLKNKIPVELTLIKLKDKVNKRIFFIKDLRDELVLKKRYKRMKENYIYLINSVNVGICITNLKGYIIFANEKFLKIFQRDEKDCIKNDIRKFFPFIKNIDNIFSKLLNQSVKEINLEVKSFNSYHEIIYIDLKISLYKEESKIVGYQFLLDDITEKKELEEEKKQLEQDKIAMEVAGATAHEINQPLTTLLLSIDLIKTTKSPQILEKCILRLEHSASKIDKIVKQLSKITKYETRSYAGKHSILNLNNKDNE